MSLSRGPQCVQWSATSWCPPFTHKTPLLCDLFWCGVERRSSRGSSQTGQTQSQVPLLPSATRIWSPVSEFTANPVQFQFNQYNPSRGRSNPAWLFQNIPKFHPKIPLISKIVLLLNIYHMSHTQIERRQRLVLCVKLISNQSHSVVCSMFIWPLVNWRQVLRRK